MMEELVGVELSQLHRKSARERRKAMHPWRVKLKEKGNAEQK